MKNLVLVFIFLLSFPTVAQAQNHIETELFDELPISRSEITTVSQLFWNAQSLQDKIKRKLPYNARKKFSPNGNGACSIETVSKTEPSADVCELNEDPSKNGKYVYVFSVQCGRGYYQVSVCSRESSKLMTQIKVSVPEKLVSDDGLLDLDSTM